MAKIYDTESSQENPVITYEALKLYHQASIENLDPSEIAQRLDKLEESLVGLEDTLSEINTRLEAVV